MAKKRDVSGELKIERPRRAQLTAKDSLKRMQEFSKRKGQFIAAIRNPEKPESSP